MSDILRLKAVLRRVPLGKTKFLEDYVQHNESDVFVPHTDGEVRRVRPVPLGPRSTAYFADEIDGVFEALRRFRDRRQAKEKRS